MFKTNKKFKILILGLIVFLLPVLFLFLNPKVGLTSKVVSGGNSLYIPSDLVVDHNIYKAARVVNVDGVVLGDVVVWAENVVINGDVQGDVIAVASSVTINGRVSGDLRVFAHQLFINGKVEKNLSAFAANLSIQKQGIILGHALIKAAYVNHEGIIRKNLDGAVKVFDMKGTVSRNVKLYVKRLRVSPHAHIVGSFSYTSPQKSDINRMVVNGKITQDVIGQRDFEGHYFYVSHEKVWAWFSKMYLFYLAVLFVGLIILSAVVFHFFPPKKTVRLDKILNKFPWQALGCGLSVNIAIPIILLLLSLSLVGIPLGLLLFAVWLGMVVISQVFLVYFIGKALLPGKKGWFSVRKNPPLTTSLLLGTVVYVLIHSFPVVGWIALFLMISWVMGGIMILKKRTWK